MRAKPIDLTDWGEQAQARFDAKVRWVPATGCMLWTSTITRFGYGQFRWRGGKVLSHRLAYALEYGDIPNGLTLDHLCRATGCVNPTHLEAVTHQVNVLRGQSIQARNAMKQTCHAGHPLGAENGIPSQLERGWRSCRECQRGHSSARDAAIRSARESLGMTHSAYVNRFGQSRAVAERVTAALVAGVPAAAICAGAAEYRAAVRRAS